MLDRIIEDCSALEEICTLLSASVVLRWSLGAAVAQEVEWVEVAGSIPQLPRLHIRVSSSKILNQTAPYEQVGTLHGRLCYQYMNE